jgi:hypothetical protein
MYELEEDLRTGLTKEQTLLGSEAKGMGQVAGKGRKGSKSSSETRQRSNEEA